MLCGWRTEDVDAGGGAANACIKPGSEPCDSQRPTLALKSTILFWRPHPRIPRSLRSRSRGGGCRPSPHSLHFLSASGLPSNWPNKEPQREGRQSQVLWTQYQHFWSQFLRSTNQMLIRHTPHKMKLWHSLMLLKFRKIMGNLFFYCILGRCHTL